MNILILLTRQLFYTSTWLPIIAIVIFSTVTFSANAQVPNYLNFKIWTTTDGLPQGKIKALEEDDFGYLWLNIDNQTYRFDGTDFREVRYLTEEGKIPPPTTHSRMVKDKDGDIWANSLESGLFIYNPATETVRNFRPIKGDATSIPDIRIKTAYQDSKGRHWVGFHKEGFALFDKKKGHCTKIIKPSRYLNNIVESRWVNEPNCFYFSEPYLWVGAMQGLLRYHPEKDELVYFDHSIPENTVNSELLNGREVGILQILEDEENRFWLATYGGGIGRFNPKTGEYKVFKNFLENKQELEVPHLAIKSPTEFWIGENRPEGFGIFNLKSGIFTFYNEEIGNSNFPKCSVYRLFTDSKNRIWVAAEEGLMLLTKERQLFPFVPLPAEAKHIQVFPNREELFFSLPQNRQFGIQNLQTKKTKIYTYPPNRRINEQQHIRAFHQTKSGKIYLHESLGIYHWNEAKEQAELFLSLPDSIMKLPSETIFSSLLDNRGMLWLGMRTQGLICIDLENKKLTVFQNKNEEISDPIVYNGYINALFEDSKGRIWYGTDRGFGYFDYEKDVFINFPYGSYQTDNLEIAMKQISGITEDFQGRIWMSSNRKGVGYLDFEKDSALIRTFTSADGLRDDGIFQLLTDGNGDIWLGTDSGIAKLSMASLTFENWGTEYSLGAIGKMSLLKNGEIIIPRGKGYLKFRPNEIKTNFQIPSAKISHFNVFDKPYHGNQALALTKEIKLNYHQNFFSFEFGSLNFFNPEFTEYAYRLRGLEENWNVKKDRRYASYTNVGGGNYVFEVKAKTTASDWSAVEKLRITVIPPFWKTNWFLLFVLTVIGAIIYGLYQIKIRQIEEKETLKTEFNQQLAEVQMTALRAQMNPHFLFNCLNSIKLFIIKNNTEIAAEYLTKFSRLIRLILQNSQNHLVDLSAELEALQLYLEMEKMRFRNQFDYAIRIEKEVDTNQYKIPPLILQPYVENAIWHGLIHQDQPNKLTISITRKADLLHCIIEDNGIGRAEAQARKNHQNARKKSMGMSITQNRIALTNELYQIKTNVEITDLKDEEGKATGTRVEVIIPVKYMIESVQKGYKLSTEDAEKASSVENRKI